MKKTLTYCFGSLLCLMTLASCQNGGSCCGRAATDVDLTGRLYPKVKIPTKSLVIVDLQNDDIEGQVAAIGLQGIVNRDSEQKIYVMNSRCKDNHGGWKTGPHDMARPCAEGHSAGDPHARCDQVQPRVLGACRAV